MALILTDGNNSNQSFADKVKAKKTLQPTAIDISTLPNPELIEGEPSVDIPMDFFQEGCVPFQHSFIARIDFTGLKFNEVKQNLDAQWLFSAKLTKGFLLLCLARKKIRKRYVKRKWFISQHVLRLIDWYPIFNPERQATSHAAV